MPSTSGGATPTSTSPYMTSTAGDVDTRKLPPLAQWADASGGGRPPMYSSISTLGPSQIFSPEGPVTANSEKIRDALRVMSTRYISLWQLGFISAGMQLTMFLLAPQRAKDVLFDEASKTAYSMRVTAYDNVQYWAPCLLAAIAMLFLKRSRTLQTLDTLFTRIATMEQSERSVLDHTMSARIEVEKRKHQHEVDGMRYKLAAVEAQLVAARAQNDVYRNLVERNTTDTQTLILQRLAGLTSPQHQPVVAQPPHLQQLQHPQPIPMMSPSPTPPPYATSNGGGTASSPPPGASWSASDMANLLNYKASRDSESRETSERVEREQMRALQQVTACLQAMEGRATAATAAAEDRAREDTKRQWQLLQVLERLVGEAKLLGGDPQAVARVEQRCRQEAHETLRREREEWFREEKAREATLREAHQNEMREATQRAIEAERQLARLQGMQQSSQSSQSSLHAPQPRERSLSPNGDGSSATRRNGSYDDFGAPTRIHRRKAVKFGDVEATRIVLEVLSSRTGYDYELLEGEMMDEDIEMSLGVDQIKRASIISDVGRRLGLGDGLVESSSLQHASTARQIIDAMVAEVSPMSRDTSLNSVNSNGH